jgi:hypothetical protein
MMLCNQQVDCNKGNLQLHMEDPTGVVLSPATLQALQPVVNGRLQLTVTCMRWVGARDVSATSLDPEGTSGPLSAHR